MLRTSIGFRVCSGKMFGLNSSVPGRVLGNVTAVAKRFSSQTSNVDIFKARHEVERFRWITCDLCQGPAMEEPRFAGEGDNVLHCGSPNGCLGLPIQEGSLASLEYLRMIAETDPQERQHIRNDLVKNGCLV